MPDWNNWSGRQPATNARTIFARTVPDIQALLRTLPSGTTVRVAGSGHSHMPLVRNHDIVLDLSALSGVDSVDPQQGTAWVWAGTPIHALGPALHRHGLGLHNQGDIDRQQIAGAVGTGTHGTGPGLGNLSTVVVGAELITASGALLRCGPQENPDLWQAARLHLGAVGVVTRLNLQLQPAYRLREAGFQATFDEIHPQLDERSRNSRHFELFWSAASDRATVKVTDETRDPPEYPLASEGSRCAWSYEVLPNHRPHLHTEMEYAIPADAGPDCLRTLRELYQRNFPDLLWPIEYRTVAADDVWLSNAFGRATVTLSVHQGIDQDDEPLFRACEEIFTSYAGRPHWGKMNYLTGSQFARLYPRWDDWWAQRDDIDPDGRFLNDWLRSVRP